MRTKSVGGPERSAGAAGRAISSWGSTSPFLSLPTQAAREPQTSGGGQLFTPGVMSTPSHSRLLTSMDSHEVLCTEYTRCFETVAPELDISVLSSPLRSPYQKWRQSPICGNQLFLASLSSKPNPQCSPQTLDSGSGLQARRTLSLSHAPLTVLTQFCPTVSGLFSCGPEKQAANHGQDNPRVSAAKDQTLLD